MASRACPRPESEVGNARGTPAQPEIPRASPGRTCLMPRCLPNRNAYLIVTSTTCVHTGDGVSLATRAFPQLEARLALDSCTLMSDHRGEQRPAEAKPEETKQCRICLDGEDPELGRLIRPCLCKGSISVCFCCISLGMVPDLQFPCAVCPCEMSTAVAKHLQLPECVLRLSAMRISLPFCPYSRYGHCDEPE